MKVLHVNTSNTGQIAHLENIKLQRFSSGVSVIYGKTKNDIKQMNEYAVFKTELINTFSSELASMSGLK